MWEEVKRVISRSHRFLLTTHVNPDGDGIGSAAALIQLLAYKGKQVYFVCDSPIQEKFLFLDFHNLFKEFSEAKELLSIDVLIILDTHKKERIGRIAEWIDLPNVTTVWIDHHSSDHSDSPLVVIDSESCSTGAMIRKLFDECGIALDLFAATGIYTSILTDTGRFSYASTNPLAHHLADECLKIGVNPHEIYHKVFQQLPLAMIHVLKKAFSRMEFYFSNRLVIQQIRFSDYASFCVNDDPFIADLDFLHELNRSIQGIACAAIFWELPHGAVRVSLRSNNGLDVGEPMKKLGGGGHPNAAGVLMELPFDHVKKKVLKLLEESCFLSS